MSSRPVEAALEIQEDGGTRQVVVDADGVTIGRAPDNAVVLDDENVSRYHVRVEREGDTLRVVDLGSSNGTRLNGRDIAPRVQEPVSDGDTITIAKHVLTVRLQSAQPASGATVIVHTADAHEVPSVEHAPPRLVLTGTGVSRELLLDKPALRIGRALDADLSIDDPRISREHAEVRAVPSGYEIVDSGSANGISFAGERVESRLLGDGDVIELAPGIALIYHDEASSNAGPEHPRSAAAHSDHTVFVDASQLSSEALSEAPQTVRFGTQPVVSVGRADSNDLVLAHPAVSRVHALFQRLADGSIAVQDAGSANGTFVNGALVEPGARVILKPTDVVFIGPHRLTFGDESIAELGRTNDLRLDAVHLNQPLKSGANLLKDISLSILPREFVAVVGVSGAGKSTLLAALTGFRRARGSVLVNGTSLYDNFDAYRTTLGYVPQDDIIHRALPVGRALDYAARLRLPPDTSNEERKQRVANVLDTLGLAERRDVPIERLSGGQRKRVSIGVELLTEPGLFFLDEATSGLDPGTESQLMRLLRRLADDGRTIVLVTHATKNVMLCDQVVFLAKGGALAYFGPPDQALTHFGVSDFDEIYEKVENEQSPDAWADMYRGSPQYAEYVIGRLAPRYPAQFPATDDAHALSAVPAKTATDHVPKPVQMRRPRGGSAFGQFRVLSQRYVDIIRRDRIYLALLFLIAPALGLIDLIAWRRDVLDPTTGDASRVLVMLFLSALIPFLVGAISSVREIVKEAAIYQRERMVSLKIMPYLASKVWVGVLFALYHAAALFAIKVFAVDFPDAGLDEFFALYVTIALAAISGVMWGLVISAVTPREEQAMLLVIGVVVIQMVFSGGIVSLGDLGPPGQVVGAATSTNWAFQGLVDAAKVQSGDCETADLATCQMPGFAALQSPAERRVALRPIDDRYHDVLNGDVYQSWAAMGVIIFVLFGALYVIQRSKDVI